MADVVREAKETINYFSLEIPSTPNGIEDSEREEKNFLAKGFCKKKIAFKCSVILTTADEVGNFSCRSISWQAWRQALKKTGLSGLFHSPPTTTAVIETRKEWRPRVECQKKKKKKKKGSLRKSKAIKKNLVAVSFCRRALVGCFAFSGKGEWGGVLHEKPQNYYENPHWPYFSTDKELGVDWWNEFKGQRRTYRDRFFFFFCA